MFDILSAIGGIGSGLASLFGGQQSDQGTQNAIHSIQGLNPQLQQLFSSYLMNGQNPMGFVNQIYSQYQPSESYKTAEQNAMKAARNAAASGGQLGTYNNQNDFATRAAQLANEDRQQWFQNVMMPYQMGMNSAGALGNLLTNNMSNLASLQYKQGQDQSKNTGGMIGGLTNLIGSFFG